MPEYKVLQEVEIEGSTHAVDTVVELSEEAAGPLVSEGKLEAVA